MDSSQLEVAAPKGKSRAQANTHDDTTRCTPDTPGDCRIPGCQASLLSEVEDYLATYFLPEAVSRSTCLLHLPESLQPCLMPPTANKARQDI